MSAGEKAIAKEIKRQEKERLQRIREANKMLIPVGKKTAFSLELISFDPDGVLYLEGNRWIKFLEMEGSVDKLLDVVKNLTGRIRVTMHMEEQGGRSSCHLTLMESGETYDEIRQKMMEDEAVMNQVVALHPLSVDMAMSRIASNFCKELKFSYASNVRGKKDWKKEIFRDVEEDMTSFRMSEYYGESFQVLSFPEKYAKGLISKLKELGCQMIVGYDFNSLSKEEQDDFKRALEKKYNQRLSEKESEDYINTSLSIVILCDSDDARKILEDTMNSIFTTFDVAAAPGFHTQRNIAESVLSMGLVDYKIMRNVTVKTMKDIVGGENYADAEIEV